MEIEIVKPPIPDVKPGRNCRLAYTLNNSQIVRCTIIGDTPLFYLDAETAYEDEAIMDENDAGLKTDFAKLQEKLQAYDTLSKNFMRAPVEKEAMFAENAARLAGAVTENNAKDLFAELRASRLATTYLDDCIERGIAVIPSAGVRTALFDRTSKVVLYNAGLAPAFLKLALVRELRRAWLTGQGAGLDPLMFHPDQAVLLNRVEAADLAVTQVRAAWEMQLAGQKDVWMAVENSTLTDMARAFGREACMDFRSLGNGEAAVAAFEAWFLSERCRRHDRRLIQLMLSAYQTAVSEGQAQVSRILGVEVIAQTGSQPYGKNYLAPYTQLIMNDPVFTEVRDRSNANFLWFIKFERAFTEAEQDLQIDTKSAPLTEEKGATSNLVELFPAKPDVAAKAKRRQPADPS